MISGMLWRVSKPSSHPFNICIIFLFPTRTGDDRGDVCVATSFKSLPTRTGDDRGDVCVATSFKSFICGGRGFLVYLRIGENLR